jgi:ABC-type branched-subunit amino acid transport system substrate-binding protein
MNSRKTSHRSSPLRIGTALAVTAMAVLVAVAVSAAATSGHSRAGACSGPTVTFEVVTNISNPNGSVQPVEVPAGAKAAAAALTKSCEYGGPVKLIICDDKFDPNATSACARATVSNKATAAIYYGGFGDNFVPILAKAGIPTLSLSGTSQSENTNPLSFPFQYSFTLIFGEINLAIATGHKNFALSYADVPAMSFVIGLVQSQISHFGGKLVAKIPIPITATDMTSYAGQVISSGADVSLATLGGFQDTGLQKALRAQGSKIQISDSLIVQSGDVRKGLGSVGKGMQLSGVVDTFTDTSKPYVKQAQSEWKAAGQNPKYLDTSQGPLTWGILHLLADALTSAKLTPTSANIPKALKTAVVPQLAKKYGIAPMDFRHPAYATNPVLSHLRIYSRRFWAFQIVDNAGKLARLAPVPLDANILATSVNPPVK